MRKVFIILLFFLVSGGAGLLFGRKLFKGQELSSKPLSTEQIIKERDLAIAKAVEAGDYRCCIEPPCTMCYMEANEWNNSTVGTCVCDDLIVQGKEPCPQCKKGLCETTEQGVCKINEK